MLYAVILTMNGSYFVTNNILISYTFYTFTMFCRPNCAISGVQWLRVNVEDVVRNKISGSAWSPSQSSHSANPPVPQTFGLPPPQGCVICGGGGIPVPLAISSIVFCKMINSAQRQFWWPKIESVGLSQPQRFCLWLPALDINKGHFYCYNINRFLVLISNK